MALSVSSRRVLKRPTTGSEKIAKYQRHKTSIILVLLCILLAAFLIGMGYLYAWLVSNQIMPNDAYNTQNYKPVEIKKPVARLNQRVNVAVSNISSPATPGETVHLSIRTNVDAVCTLEVLTPVKKLIDATLGAKSADEFGIVSWSWVVPADTKDTSWPVSVTCNNREYSGVVKTTVVIAAKR